MGEDAYVSEGGEALVLGMRGVAVCVVCCWGDVNVGIAVGIMKSGEVIDWS